MIAANVLSKEEFPDFDDETGILPKVDDEEGKMLFYPFIMQPVYVPVYLSLCNHNTHVLLIDHVYCHADEDLEIELVEEEPPFLRGHTKQSMDMSPVKIVKVQYTSKSSPCAVSCDVNECSVY